MMQSKNKKKTIKKVVKKKVVKKPTSITDVEVIEMPSDDEKMKNARAGRERTELLRKTIQAMIPKGVVEDLQQEVLENWAEMLQSDDLRIWATATKELSKFLFPQKREHQQATNVNINCTFNGIMTQDAMGGKVVNNQSDTKLLEQVKTDLMAQVAQIDILIHGKKGKK